MQPFSTQRQEVLDLCQRAAETARRRDPALAEQFADAGRQLDDGKLTLAVIGEFKRGKSSLLNALLEEPGLFPVETTIATSLVTTATYAEQERVTVTLDDEREVDITRAEIADYVTERRNPGNQRGARLVTAQLPSPKLKDGLVVCDTPGTGGLNREHTAVTYGFVARADAVLFVIDALTPLSTEELQFLETVREHCHAVVFAVTKIDKVAGYDVMVTNAREKITAVFGERATEIPIVPVSSILKLEWLRHGDDEDLQDSNYLALEEAVWGLLRRRRGALLLLRPLSVLARGLDGLIAPMEAELATYSGPAAAAESEDELKAGAERVESLRRGEAAWRRRLARELQDLNRDIGFEIRRRSMVARRALTTALDEQANLNEPQLIVGIIERELVLLAADLTTVVEDRLAVISGHVEGETGLKLNPVASAGHLAVDVGEIEAGSVNRDAITGVTVLKAGMGMGAGMTALAMPLALVGLFPVAIIGLAAIAGGAQGARIFVKEQQKRDRAELQSILAKRLQPMLDDELQRIDEHVRRAIAAGERALTDDLDEKLVQERTRLTDSAAAIRAARSRTKEEAARRIAELRAPVATLRNLRTAVEAHIASALAAAEEEPEEPVAPEPPEPLPDLTSQEVVIRRREPLPDPPDGGEWPDLDALLELDRRAQPARTTAGAGRNTPDLGEWAEV